LDERGNRTERRRARTGGREAGWAWDSTADERRQHESGKEDRRPEALGVSQGTQHNEPRKVRLAVAPMSRVHDKADKHLSGKCQLQRQPQAAEIVGATMIAQ
jgi:hypothetical protein